MWLNVIVCFVVVVAAAVVRCSVQPLFSLLNVVAAVVVQLVLQALQVGDTLDVFLAHMRPLFSVENTENRFPRTTPFLPFFLFCGNNLFMKNKITYPQNSFCSEVRHC